MLVVENLWFKGKEYQTTKLSNNEFEQHKTESSAPGFRWSKDVFEIGKTYYLHFELELLEGEIKSIGGHALAYNVKKFFVNGMKVSTNQYVRGFALSNSEDKSFILDLEFEVLENTSETNQNFYIQMDRRTNSLKADYVKFRLNNFYLTTEKDPDITIVPMDMVDEGDRNYHKVGNYREIQIV